MGQQCCQPLLNNQPYLVKALEIQQKQFSLLQNHQKLQQDNFIKQNVTDLGLLIENKKIYKHEFEQKYYVGDWQSGAANGQGILYIPYNVLYSGDFVSGKPNGNGKMSFINKQQQYQGNFNNGKANGLGILKNTQKKYTFQGQWSNSRPYQGILTFQQNPYISKIQIKDYNLGLAMIKYKDGRVYEGCIDQGKMFPQGEGEITFSDGSVYKGGWKNGLMHGEGIYEWKDGSKYEGSYFQGKKQGRGTFYYTSGKKYVGMWVNGKQEGQGKIVMKNGQVQKQGIWKTGNFQKPFQSNEHKLQSILQPKINHENENVSN